MVNVSQSNLLAEALEAYDVKTSCTFAIQKPMATIIRGIKQRAGRDNGKERDQGWAQHDFGYRAYVRFPTLRARWSN